MQPISEIRWIHYSELIPNLYNPNKVFKPEMDLLKVSILSDGWLFPVIVFDKEIQIPDLTNNPNKDKHTIIDGFHRTSLVEKDKEVKEFTNGLVPCIILNPVDPLATTVRMNRAKGVHGVLPMSKIIQREIDEGTELSVIMERFGMEKEEVIRLAERVGIAKTDLIKGTDFGSAWVPE
jgi:hypothetical protein